MGMSSWDYWVEGALSRLESMKIRRSLRPIYLPNIEEPNTFENESENASNSDAFEVFDGLRQWDRASVEMQISEATFQKWLGDIPSLGDDTVCSNREADDEAVACPQKFKKLLLFSGNDYLGLSSHPTIAKAAAKAALEHGMGPRGSALICGYTNYHRLLESSLADLKKKEDCLLCPTGFSANMALMTAIGDVGSLLAEGKKPLQDERVAIFSDALNHASIIDGIRLAERRWNVEVFVYRHCDMSHLDAVLSSCTMEKKVVVTDSLFSMDGDFAPMVELVKLRRKHGFLLAIDDAHGTFVCGENGGGVPEEFKCESEVDICVGTLSKAAGCHGGFIACNKRWKQLIQSTGRSFIFSTAIPVPVVAAAHAAIIVAKRETWRRSAIRNRLRDFQALTGIPITSPIISLIVGSEEKALQASRHLLKSGFHVIAIRPPTVPAKSCRLRVTLSAAHTVEDLKRLTAALHQCINFQAIGIYNTNGYAKL
ncbi:8-amino-7-oxononanoate synthase isoform X1 [Cornus florida]|uniref:8-amino-7-oxononanoate synthase isoform X1 n=1 Tax=Cornus florida TaxID=4283 RepID=UPI00289F25F4|nr:8-amino-7-oxononanoate synthase isoform X1 [Cornus florida]XP_059666924.1 8-amino-7-oxononanoate synthase isoform X1 [Cornus florida]